MGGASTKGSTVKFFACEQCPWTLIARTISTMDAFGDESYCPQVSAQRSYHSGKALGNFSLNLWNCHDSDGTPGCMVRLQAPGQVINPLHLSFFPTRVFQQRKASCPVGRCRWLDLVGLFSPLVDCGLESWGKRLPIQLLAVSVAVSRCTQVSGHHKANSCLNRDVQE